MSLSRSVIKAHDVRWSRPASAAPEPVRPQPAAPPPPPPAAPAPLDLDAAQQSMLTAAIAQSQQILEKARAQAAELLSAAQAQAEAVTAQARRDGLEAAEAETAQVLLSAQGVVDEVRVWRETIARQSEAMLLELVVDMARALFGEGWSLDRDSLHAAFVRALAEARPLGDLRVHVHPDDAAVLGPRWPEQQSAQLGQRLELVPDPAIRRGGCLVEGDYGAVDARVETQLQFLGETLTSAAAQPSAEAAGEA